MPGHIISVNCPCGYETNLDPGSNAFAHNVIAYRADQSEFITIDSEGAEKARLNIIPDPALSADAIGSTYLDNGWCPYLCQK